MYYFRYNNVDLTDVTKMQKVEIPSLPSMTHSSIDSVFNRDGNIFNGLSYGNREINIQFLIQPDDPTEYDTIVNDVKQTFYTKKVAPLYLGDETLYMWAVPIDDLIITELGNYCCQVEVTLVAYDPYWYNKNRVRTNNDDKKKFTVTNTSDLPVYPTINLSVDKKAHFVQIENQTTGKIILLGNYPSLEKEKVANEEALVDECESLSAWTQSNEDLDSGRGKGGTLAIANGGSGIVIGDFGSDSTSLYHGACYRRSLDTPVKNFKATFDIAFTSSGINGDPTRPYENDTETTVISGKKGTYYEATATTNYRDKPSVKKGKKLGSFSKGYKITSFTKVNSSWIKTTYNGKTVYVSTKYLKKKVSDGTITTKERNYVVIKSVNLRTQPTTGSSSSVILTLKAGTVIRCYTEKYGGSQGYLKLAKKYNGKIGYVFEEGYLIKASDYEVDYDYEVNTADDKTGVIEVYGFASDNTQIFKVGMYDDNEWYEHNVPVVTYNTKTILTDKTNAPTPDEHIDYDEDGADVDRLLSGTYGNWNDVEHCEFYIQRYKNKVWASVTKVVDGIAKKTITSGSSYLDTSIVKDLKLSYIVLYIGTSADKVEKASDMMLNYAIIENEDSNTTKETDVAQIPQNSEIVIDNSTPKVSIDNKERNELVDIGSEFFTLEPGENNIKITSDATVNCDIVYREKYL